MSKLRVHCFSVSLDGYGAGPSQDLDNPLGVGGVALHKWAFATRTFQQMFGNGGGATGIDNDFAARGFEGIGAWIIGRNMFGPVRGPWPDDTWKGWWGDIRRTTLRSLFSPTTPAIDHDERRHDLPLRHRWHSPRTRACRRCREWSGFGLGGGIATMQQYLRAGLVDQMHLVVSPALLGSGEHLFQGINLPALGYQLTDHIPSPGATHMILTRQK